MSYQEKCCIVWYETNLFIPGQLKGHFKGFAGGIRCISCLDKQQMVVSCGLDKFLRVHHLHNRKLLHKVGLSRSWQILCFSSDEKCTVYFGGLQFAICGLFYVCREVFFKDLEFFFSCMYLFIHFFWKLGLLNANSERFLVYSFNYRKELRLCLSFFAFLLQELWFVYFHWHAIRFSLLEMYQVYLTCNRPVTLFLVSWCLIRHLLSLYFKTFLFVVCSASFGTKVCYCWGFNPQFTVVKCTRSSNVTT